jgi:PEP-CTERM motif
LNEGAVGKTERRRRSWYTRRLRIQRTALAAVVGALVAVACWQNAARYLSLPALHSSQILPDSFWMRANLHKDPVFAASSTAKPAKFVQRIPGVYPYSVVPGGVKDLTDLRYAAARDYVVRRHYSHFDFSHAKLIRLPETREVFLSYRIRDTVFWTRKRVRLHPGELLLTDGKITARARCGNQISDTAKPEVSDEEPDEDVLDEPVVAVAFAPSLPIRPVLAPPDLPVGQPSPPALYGGPFLFPYIAVGLPMPRVCPVDDVERKGNCVPKRHRKPIVPEPSTMLLLASGLALIVWRYRKTIRPALAT